MQSGALSNLNADSKVVPNDIFKSGGSPYPAGEGVNRAEGEKERGGGKAGILQKSCLNRLLGDAVARGKEAGRGVDGGGLVNLAASVFFAEKPTV